MAHIYEIMCNMTSEHQWAANLSQQKPSDSYNMIIYTNRNMFFEVKHFRKITDNVQTIQKIT